MTKDEALKLALEALEIGLPLIEDFGSTEQFNAQHKAIAAIKEALAQQEQEPVAWLTEERYAEMHTSKWSPKIQQLFNKDGTLESQTIQYAPQSIPAPYPLQRTWVGLTDEELMQCLDQGYGINMRFDGFARIIEAKLKEKNVSTL